MMDNFSDLYICRQFDLFHTKFQTYENLILQSLILFHAFSFLLIAQASKAQFLREYGTSLNESFIKVIRSGTEFYVLGRCQLKAGGSNIASVTRIDASGNHLWTLSLDFASEWTDAVLTPTGGLLVVGHSLPLDATTFSLMGLVASNGSFTWVRIIRLAWKRFLYKDSAKSCTSKPFIPILCMWITKRCRRWCTTG
ncbi:MAG: hypothetical protein IPP42_18510 [Saprospiraceae bacterium]|nr:hypothetical protein [Saprospiraceae bacterium]